MGVTIHDVAKSAGVSVATVSRVMNNKGALSNKTKSKVWDAINELNHYPSQIARNLYSQKSQIIGVIVPDVSHNFYAKNVKCIEQCLCRSGYKMMLCNTLQQQNLEMDYIKMLQCNKVDGIILASHTLESEVYDKINLPLVSMDRYLGENIPVVSSDHYAGGELAAEELIRNKCTNIVQIVCDTQIPKPSNDKHIAFNEKVCSADLNCDSINIPLNTLDFSAYVDIAKQLFLEFPYVDGVFCADNIACAIMQEAVSRRAAIPYQLKIVGYDGNDICAMVVPTLTTVVQNVNLLAETAVDILMRRINGETVTGIHKIPVYMNIGGTTLPKAKQ